MTLNELLETILDSDRSDWNLIGCGGSSGSSYRYSFTAISSLDGQPTPVLYEDSHHTVASYMPDIDITLAFGMICNPEYQDDWVDKFINKKAFSEFVDVFYKGSLVFREVFVAVDGAKAYLPIPKSSEDLTCPRDYCRFVELMHSLGVGASEFDWHFKLAGFEMTDEVWNPFNNG